MTIEQYFRNLASAAFVPLFFWAVLAVSMHQDRSRYRNTIYLMLAMVSSLPFAAALFGPAEQTAAGVISAGILILLLAVPYMLIANGVTMIRKEGRRLADLLSLLMGILVGTGELSFFLFILLPYLSSGASGTAGNISKVQMSLLFIGLSVIYFSLVFVSFMFYTRFMGILPIRKDFDCCIILGCGLLAGGKVSKLLAGRLDKAIELYRKDPTPPVMIPSGGQGPDEAVSEASAMRDYLIANGIPEDMIRSRHKRLSRIPGSSHLQERRPEVHRHWFPNSFVLLAQCLDPRICSRASGAEASCPSAGRVDFDSDSVPVCGSAVKSSPAGQIF